MAVKRYITAAMRRSSGLTRRFQKSTAAATVAMNGNTTAPRLAIFSALPISECTGSNLCCF